MSMRRVKNKIIVWISALVLFILTLFFFQTRLVSSIDKFYANVDTEKTISQRYLLKLSVENLINNWSIQKRMPKVSGLRIIDIIKQTLSALEDKEYRSRRSTTTKSDEEKQYLDSSINLADLLGIISWSLINDLKIVSLTLIISTILGLSLPVLFSSFSGLAADIFYSITFIPPFLILTLVYYLKSGSLLLYIVVLGILTSTRLGITISNAVKSLEKDEYVIYLLIGRHRRMKITSKFTYREIFDTIVWTTLWTFYTTLSLNLAVSMGGVSLIRSSKLSLGIFLTALFSELPSRSALLQLLILSMLVGLVLFIPYQIANSICEFYYLKTGLSKEKKKRCFTIKLWEKVGRTVGGKIIPELDLDSFEGIFIKGLTIGPKDGESNRTIIIADDMTIKKGDKIFVTGPSGSGKTILTNAIVGILWDKKLRYSGYINYKFGDKVFNVIEHRNSEFLLKSGIIELTPQNPKHAFNPYVPVRTQIEDFKLMEEFLELLSKYFRNDEGQLTFNKILEGIKLTPNRINDGTLQVVNFLLSVARIKKNNGGILLLDESVASVSNSNLQKIYQILKHEIWDNKNLSVFWIGHETETLEFLHFDKVLEISMDDNENASLARVIPYGEKEDLLMKYKLQHQQISEKFRNLIELNTNHKNTQNKLKKVYDIMIDKIEFPLIEVRPSEYIQVAEGEVVFITGDNGSGKSTLIKALIGYFRNEVVGEVLWYSNGDKLVINKSKLKTLFDNYWNEVDVVFQNPDISVPKNLIICAKEILNIDSEEKEEEFKKCLSSVGLENVYGKRFFQLSYGQKKRLQLARVLLKKPKVTFLDEPTASLDIWNIEKMVEEIRQVKELRADFVLFLVTHNELFKMRNIESSNRIKLVEMQSFNKM